MKTNLLNRIWMLLSILVLTVTHVWGDTITLTESDVSSNTSYNTSENTFTNGVQFGYINVLTNNSNNTPTGWAKNQVMQSKNGSYLYNKDALSTIKNVKVYIVVADNNLSIGYGTSEKPTTNKIDKTDATKGSQSITYTSYANRTTKENQSTTATTYDFDLSSYNATYFTIIPGGATYIWKVEITYSSTHIVVPTYEVTYSYDASYGAPTRGGSTVTNETVSSISELPTIADKDDCDWKFAGWSKTNTSLTAASLITTPYAVTSEHTLYAVYKKTESSGGESGNTTIDVSTSGVNSYGDGENKGDYNWSYTQLQKGQECIQGNSSKSSILWNTKAFDRAITKVELVVGYAAGTNSTAALSFGNTAKPTSKDVSLGKNTSYSLTSTGTLTITDIPANSTYMSLSWTSGASYYSSVKVYWGSSQTTTYSSSPDCTPPCTNLGQINGSVF